jgi:hypothetical protein
MAHHTSPVIVKIIGVEIVDHGRSCEEQGWQAENGKHRRRQAILLLKRTISLGMGDWREEVLGNKLGQSTTTITTTKTFRRQEQRWPIVGEKRV